MQADEISRAVQGLQPDLRRLGVQSLVLFGSLARGTATENSDIDMAVVLSNGVRGLDRLQVLDELAERLTVLFGVPVDLIEEPVRKPRLRKAIARDGIRVF